MVSQDEPDFVLNGARLCVDFVNTELVEAGLRKDLLQTDADLMRWAAAVGLLGHSTAAKVGGCAGSIQVAELRAAVRSVLERHLDGRAPSRASLATINATLATAVSGGRLTFSDGQWSVAPPRADVATILRAVAEDLVALLCSDELERLGRCSNHDCILLFVDRSRTRARRWCSMQVCGNRAKVAAHGKRVRASTKRES